MNIDKKQALVILEMIGNVGNYAGNRTEEEDLDNVIRENFPDLEDYDYREHMQELDS